jgi:hypothetical protein
MLLFGLQYFRGAIYNENGGFFCVVLREITQGNHQGMPSLTQFDNQKNSNFTKANQIQGWHPWAEFRATKGMTYYFLNTRED